MNYLVEYQMRSPIHPDRTLHTIDGIFDTEADAREHAAWALAENGGTVTIHRGHGLRPTELVDAITE
ncbi:hypothetical protein ACFJIY_08600 [Pimelobacter simplex]|uniref:hypothetical protein n=1 Tax=Nocardioides simplex TaxID=2045 RepID=UPI003671E626